MHKGTTLTELVVVLAIIGLLAAIAVPSGAAFMGGVLTERAAHELMAAHRIARFTAIMRSRVTRLEVRADSLVVSVLNDRDTTVVWRAAGPAAAGVLLAAPAHALVFTPTGLPYGLGNGTYTFTRGSARRAVVISRLGRLRIVRD
jgi:prepilin-type N-terminal cleavage/methylation domain-containing protein